MHAALYGYRQFSSSAGSTATGTENVVVEPMHDGAWPKNHSIRVVQNR